MRTAEEIISILNYRGHLKFIPDKTWIKYRYRQVFHKKLDLDNPKTFNEKMLWMKLNYRDSRCSQMVDKIGAKKYVEKIIGGVLHTNDRCMGFL